jgi:hypothetical protein
MLFEIYNSVMHHYILLKTGVILLCFLMKEVWLQLVLYNSTHGTNKKL